MNSNGPRDSRRMIFLLALAAVIVTAGLAAAISAPGSSPVSNKADGYGGPVTPAPTHPKSVGECNKYWGATNPGSEKKLCVAEAHKNAGNKKCAKLKGAKKTACKKKVAQKYAKEKNLAKKLQAAEKKCNSQYSAALQNLNPDDPDYDAKQKAADEDYATCRKNNGLS